MFVLFVSLIVLAFFLIKGSEDSTSETLIPLRNFGQSDIDIDISAIQDSDFDKLPIFYISQDSHTEIIEEIISRMGLFLNREETGGYSSSIWSDGETIFTYEGLTGILVFELSRSYPLQGGEESFSEFFFKFLDRRENFQLVRRTSMGGGANAYYAARSLEGVNLELGYDFDYSDVLFFDQSGFLKGGRVLLSEINKEDAYSPLISVNDLKRYINDDSYPKETYIKTFELHGLIDLHYLEHEWADITESASNCKAINSELIYLYKSISQEYLYPTYKLNANCEVFYEDEVYSVPATIYVNAINPQFVIVE